MHLEQIVLVFLGALAGGLVNGLTGFGLGITAIGIWLLAIPTTVAASLAIACSVASQAQTLRMIWPWIEWRRVLPFVIPGLAGVPLGTWLLSQIDARTFKIGVGAFLVAYSAYVLARKRSLACDFGGRKADAIVGLGGGVLGGLAGFSGPLPVVWTDIRGWSKEQRRSVLQVFNLSILAFALVSHALSGLLTRQFALAASVAIPGSVCGVWIGALAYRRLGDRGYQRAVMMLLLASGLVLIATSG
jgi:hypothetical protein